MNEEQTSGPDNDEALLIALYRKLGLRSGKGAQYELLAELVRRLSAANDSRLMPLEESGAPPQAPSTSRGYLGPDRRREPGPVAEDRRGKGPK